MTEHVFMQTEDVLITNARAVIQDQTFALANITSVRAEEYSPNAGVGCMSMLLGLFALLGAIMEPTVFVITGLVFLGAGIWLWSVKHYRVVLATAGSEQRVYECTSSEMINRIVRAVSNAIVHRG